MIVIVPIPGIQDMAIPENSENYLLAKAEKAWLKNMATPFMRLGRALRFLILNQNNLLKDKIHFYLAFVLGLHLSARFHLEAVFHQTVGGT